jgi:hypothetical protein
VLSADALRWRFATASLTLKPRPLVTDNMVDNKYRIPASGGTGWPSGVQPIALRKPIVGRN